MADDQLPIMPFFVRDYIAATRKMTLEQRGAYTDLLFFQWDTGALPADPVALARMLGASVEHFSSIWPGIADKFEVVKNSLVNSRVEIERKKVKKLKRSNTQKAKTAANARWGKGKKPNSRHMRQALLEECPPYPSPSPSSPDQDSRRGGDPPPVGSLKTQIYRLAGQLEIHAGVITPAIQAHSETQVWQALGATLAAKPAEPLPYFRSCLKSNGSDKRMVIA